MICSISCQMIHQSFAWIWKAFLETKFGMMPIRSVLSYQCSLIPADFNVYFNILTVNECDYLQFPDFPFSKTKNNIQSYINKIKDTRKQ